jgi:kinesin family protein 6/9
MYMSLDTCTAVLVLLRHAMASKRKLLTLQDKIKVIQLSKGGLSSRKIADEFNVGRTQVQNILKRKIEFREDFENNASPERKRRRNKNANEEINELSWTVV